MLQIVAVIRYISNKLKTKSLGSDTTSIHRAYIGA
mgnify:CR=1 FL=1